MLLAVPSLQSVQGQSRSRILRVCPSMGACLQGQGRDAPQSVCRDMNNCCWCVQVREWEKEAAGVMEVDQQIQADQETTRKFRAECEEMLQMLTAVEDDVRETHRMRPATAVDH